MISRRNFINTVVNKTADEIIPGATSNCFNAVRNAFSESLDLKKDGPKEMLSWLCKNCEQVHDAKIAADIFVVWSSDDIKKSPDKVDVHFLAKRTEGYPFALRIEHAGVFLELNKVFQKASPKA
ncbi:MAG: hypothetical protein H7326_11385 [Bdellovibrionaceae bacterium]|nr:hypothetical protein [Pseudobdellovibrionaceae bacterium]